VCAAAGTTAEPGRYCYGSAGFTARPGGRSLRTCSPTTYDDRIWQFVYYLGQEQCYYEQFYDSYRDAPIFAIPGNHDGMISPSLKQKTLQGSLDNFCTEAPTHNPDAQGHARTTMTQPGVYFELDAPFVKIIGLYSNISEGTTSGVISGNKVGNAQLTFLRQQLEATAKAGSHGDHRASRCIIRRSPAPASTHLAPAF
jgi:hypothetical protein